MNTANNMDKQEVTGSTGSSGYATDTGPATQDSAEEEGVLCPILDEHSQCSITSWGINVNARDENGSTLLHLAAGIGNVPKLKYLLKKGADLRATDNQGRTALHDSALHGQTAAVKTLLEFANANNMLSRMINLIDKYTYNVCILLRGQVEDSMAYYVVECGREMIALLKKKAANNELIDAMSIGHLRYCGWGRRPPGRHALEIRTHDDKRVISHNTALYYSLRQEHEEISCLLLDYGADPTIKNYSGDTALHRAHTFKNDNIILILRRGGVRAYFPEDVDVAEPPPEQNLAVTTLYRQLRCRKTHYGIHRSSWSAWMTDHQLQLLWATPSITT